MVTILEEGEVFRHVKGFAGIYKVSNCGTVIRVKGKKILSSFPVKGRLVVHLSEKKINGKQGKTHFIDRLVVDSFFREPSEPLIGRTRIIHIDGNLLNSHRDNLKEVNFVSHG